MKTHLGKQTFYSGCLLAICCSLPAAPLQRADVIRDPAWVVHLDCDSLRRTTLGGHLLDELEKPAAERNLNNFQAMFDVDLRRDLHGVTLFGMTMTPEDFVLVVYADFNAERLTELARSAEDYSSTEHGNRTIHSWRDRRRAARAGDSPRIYAAIYGRRVIFSRKSDQVARELDVLDRAAPSLAANKDFDALDTSGADTFIEAAARRVKLPEANPGAAVFRQARMIRLTVAEAQRQVTGTLSIAALNEEAADRIASLARGVIAFFEMQTEKPEAVKLAEALSVRRDGDNVKARLSLPVDDVVKMIRARAGKKVAKR